MQNKYAFFTEEDFALRGLNKVHCNLYGDEAVVIEGHKGLKNFSLDKILFKADKKTTLSVLGNDLSIKQLTKNYALIVGKISGVLYEDF